MVLQKNTGLLTGEPGSYSETGVTSFYGGSEVIGEGVKEVTNINRDEGQEQVVHSIVKTEREVSC